MVFLLMSIYSSNTLVNFFNKILAKAKYLTGIITVLLSKKVI